MGGQSFNHGATVDVRLVCGVYPGQKRDAGWSVYLNDRAVLLANKTHLTGWGEDEVGRIPNFHGQYSRFRGYAFLECVDTTRLPWDTTKTRLDEDDPIYRRARALMVDAADPVVDFLDAVKDETAGRKRGSSDGPLLDAIRTGRQRSVFDLKEGGSRQWRAPSSGRALEPKPEGTTRIFTDQPDSRYRQATRRAGVSGQEKLGDYLFEYFASRELR